MNSLTSCGGFTGGVVAGSIDAKKHVSEKAQNETSFQHTKPKSTINSPQ